MDSKQLKQVGITSALAGLASSGLTLALVNSSEVLSRLDANIGIVIAYSGYVIVAIALLVIFHKFKIAKNWRIVIFSLLTLESLTPALFGQWFSNHTLQAILVLTLTFPLVFAGYYCIFNAWKFDETLKLVFGVIIVTAATFAGTQLAQHASDVQYENEQDAKFEQHDYEYFLPASVPAGYKVHSVSPPYDSDPAPYVEVSYLYGTNELGDPSPFSIYLFEKDDRFNPPSDCGPEYPNTILDFAFPCEPIGTLSTGETVYHHDSSFSNTYNTYVQIGDTMVVLHESSIDRDNGVRLELMRSLQRISVSDMQELDD